MEIITALIGAAFGAIAGFCTSYFFWNRGRLQLRPRVEIGARSGGSNQAQFYIENKGSSYAEDILAISKISGKELFSRPALREGDKEFVFHLNFEESEELVLSFRDVWHKAYISFWRLEGEHWEGFVDEENPDNSEVWHESFSVVRLKK